MEFDDFNCPLCNSNYNTASKIPRLLTKCGHTFCESCLIEKFKENSNIRLECPEDNFVYEDILKITDLPTNIIVLNLIQKLEQRSRTNSINGNTMLQTPNKLSTTKSLFSQECAETLNFIPDANHKNNSAFSNKTSLISNYPFL